MAFSSRRSVFRELEEFHLDNQRCLQDLMSNKTFAIFSINTDLVRSLSHLRINQCTHIQEKMLDKFLVQQKNVFVLGSTGTGKTLGAIICIMNQINKHSLQPQALFVVATKEAAQQVVNKIRLHAQEEIRVTALLQHENVHLGGKFETQIIVGTPKEICASAITRQFEIETIEAVVLDDVDLIDTSDLFKKHITHKLDAKCMKIYMVSRECNLQIPQGFELVVEHCEPIITQKFIRCNDISVKIAAIVNVYNLLKRNDAQGLIFCRTRDTIETIVPILNLKKCSTGMIHSHLSDEKRNDVMNEFNSGKHTFLMTTNLLCRAVDFESVRVVINFDMPDNAAKKTFDPKAYMYRIGRCGRFGLHGLALSLIDVDDEHYLQQLNSISEII